MDKAKQVALNVQDIFNTLATMTPDEIAALTDVTGRPVGLRDTPMFNISVELISSAEISDLRRQLAEAIAFEKWVDGFVFAMQLVMMLAGGI